MAAKPELPQVKLKMKKLDRKHEGKSKSRPSECERVCHPEIQNRLKGRATRLYSQAIDAAKLEAQEDIALAITSTAVATD
jgi:hypothetical protein